jgi:cyclopropane-fatty-acyl-phospholipid synthase
MVNHAIARPGHKRTRMSARKVRFARRSFVDHFVFPDGELHEIGAVISAMQRQGFEVRHEESLREHYALTLRNWVRNLEGQWDAAVAEAGAGRARVWRLYMAASAVNFEDGNIQVHQALGVKSDGGASGMPLRARFEF